MTDRTAFAQGLRDLADALDAHPEIPLPTTPFFARIHPPTDLDDERKREYARRRAAEIARAIPSKVDKQAFGSVFSLSAKFGPISVDFDFNREQVCERVVTGTRTVTEEEPDPDAMAQVPKRTVTREVEDVEWRCPDSLLGSTDGDDDAALPAQPPAVEGGQS